MFEVPAVCTDLQMGYRWQAITEMDNEACSLTTDVTVRADFCDIVRLSAGNIKKLSHIFDL